jgi:hypothetical protein
MGAFLVVVPDIVPEDSLKMTFRRDRNVVQAEGYGYTNSCRNSVIFIDQPAQFGHGTTLPADSFTSLYRVTPLALPAYKSVNGPEGCFYSDSRRNPVIFIN